MNRFVVLIIICSFLIISSWLPGDIIGVSSECHNGNCNVAAGTSLQSALLALFLVVFTIFYPQKNNHKQTPLNFSTTHKVVSFVLDFIITFLIIAPFIGLPLLISESIHLGSFQWSVQRDYTRSSDFIYILLGFILLAYSIYYYFLKHKSLKKLTIGQYVLSNIK